MNKIIFVATLCALLVGCENGPSYYVDKTQDYKLPEALQDCEIFYLRGNASYLTLTVMRCPNSSTTTSSLKGKIRAHTVVIEGTTYVEEKK